MRFSAAMLKGFEMVGGRQHFGDYCAGDPTRPVAVCAVGAAYLARHGNARKEDYLPDSLVYNVDAFRRLWGMDVAEANDLRLPWEHVYAMARAAGI